MGRHLAQSRRNYGVMAISEPVHFRPHRHLCPEADARDAMSDADFWAHVYPQEEYDGPSYNGMDDQAIGPLAYCEMCGSVGACAFDAEGRPLIHPITEEDE